MQPCADPAKVLYERRLVIGLHPIHRCCKADRVFFPVGEKLLRKFQLVRRSLYDSTCTQRVAFVTVDDLLARTLFLSRSLSCYFLFILFLASSCLYLHLFLSVVILLFTIHRSFQASENQFEPLRDPKINSLCRAVGLSSFILPASLSCSHRQPFFCDFLHCFDHPCDAQDVSSLRTRVSSRFLHPSRTRFPINESNCYFTIAELHRSDTCELHIIFVSFECRFIPHRTPIALKRVLVLRWPTDHPTSRISEFSPLNKFIS